ncbi:hypothetical protein [Methylobacterium soli]|uniref:Uncharacterized protein n=1 Tax=Methylobacterium soli TaxID=553447 RepID=A0A6L3SWZ5_9HYPH|nr:hypothetical protein [Methylobacterium soli]KAB1077104.1 hypothetical protein F6X53_20760 [Methylobacterium soli]
MSNERKPELGFGMGKVMALAVPVEATADHTPHQLDAFTIELDDDADMATIYLSEVDMASGRLLVIRESMKFSLTMLAGVAPIKPDTGLVGSEHE